MSNKSHYETLGVDTKANKDEIKKAYRQLSMKYHPDKNGGSVEKSQELNEAYEILKDDETRMQYDQQQQGSPFPFPFHAGHSDLDDILGALFGGSMNGVHVKMNMGGMNMGGMHMGGMNMGTMHMGGEGFPGIRIFHQTSMPSHHQHSFQISKPEPITKMIQIDLSQIMEDFTISVEIEKWTLENGNKLHSFESLQVQIPQGVENNEVITLPEKGNVINEFGMVMRGDVQIVVQVQNNSLYQRNGLDLLIEQEVTFKQSLCGFSLQLKYINGNEYTLNSTKGTIIQNDSSKIIPNLGLKRMVNGIPQIGKLIITFKIPNVPVLTDAQLAKLNEILE